MCNTTRFDRHKHVYYIKYNYINSLYKILSVVYKSSSNVDSGRFRFTAHTQSRRSRALDVHWMFTECSLNVHWMFTGCSLKIH
jgi:hypothetical protein